jgi:catechol 2,3-dioxygenase-like lactoylglutathione lyase family enzyme
MSDDARIVEIEVADDPSAWADAGFAVDGDAVALGPLSIRLVGWPADGTRGIVGWTLTGVAVEGGSLDGLATAVTEPRTAPLPQPTHPNGVTGLDHVVVLTPDLDRTIAAVERAGAKLRRVRDTESYGSPMRQAFFRFGPTIVEVVSGDTGTGLPAADAPASWFGLAVDVDDLDETAAVLGDGLGAIKPAVQDGRRIATLRHRSFDVSVAIAAMDHHGDR